MRALVMQHEEASPPAHVVEWCRKRGIEATVWHAHLELPPADLSAFDFAVALGSEFSANDDLHWLRPEREVFRELHSRGTPLLGICFGAQVLAQELGGHVERLETPEIGWLEVGPSDSKAVPDVPWFQWHFDAFVPPPEAEVIARNEFGAQAFRIGPHLGVQFHPEVTMPLVDRWIEVYMHELTDNDVEPEELLERSRREVASSQRAAAALFDEFVAGLSD